MEQLKESCVTVDVPHFRKRQKVNAKPGQAQHVKFADTAGKTMFTVLSRNYTNTTPQQQSHIKPVSPDDDVDKRSVNVD